MIHTNLKELTLVFFALIGQLFSCMNISFVNLYLKETKYAFNFFFTGNQLHFTYWLLLTMFGRVSGAYFIGKYADKAGFFKSILAVSKYYVFLSVLTALLCFTHEFNYDVSFGFYVFRFFYSFLESAALILPIMYVFSRSSHINYYKISVLLIGAVFVAKSASYHLVYLPSGFVKFWYILPLAATSISWMIYFYLKKYSTHEAVLNLKDLYVPLRIKILNTLLGAACAAGAFYHHFFVNYYLLNINIVDASFDFGGVIYYTLCGLFLLPAAKLCERFGLYQTTKTSLSMLFLLGVVAILASPTPMMYVALQILFSFFSALFIAPVLAVLYKLYKNYPSIYNTMFWFMLGFCTCMVLAFFEQKLGIKNAGIGWCVYSTSILLCFIEIYKFRQDELAGRMKDGVKLFEI